MKVRAILVAASMFALSPTAFAAGGNTMRSAGGVAAVPVAALSAGGATVSRPSMATSGLAQASIANGPKFPKVRVLIGKVIDAVGSGPGTGTGTRGPRGG